MRRLQEAQQVIEILHILAKSDSSSVCGSALVQCAAAPRLLPFLPRPAAAPAALDLLLEMVHCDAGLRQQLGSEGTTLDRVLALLETGETAARCSAGALLCSISNDGTVLSKLASIGAVPRIAAAVLAGSLPRPAVEHLAVVISAAVGQGEVAAADRQAAAGALLAALAPAAEPTAALAARAVTALELLSADLAVQPRFCQPDAVAALQPWLLAGGGAAARPAAQLLLSLVTNASNHAGLLSAGWLAGLAGALAAAGHATLPALLQAAEHCACSGAPAIQAALAAPDCLEQLLRCCVVYTGAARLAALRAVAALAVSSELRATVTAAGAPAALVQVLQAAAGSDRNRRDSSQDADNDACMLAALEVINVDAQSHNGEPEVAQALLRVDGSGRPPAMSQLLRSSNARIAVLAARLCESLLDGNADNARRTAAAAAAAGPLVSLLDAPWTAESAAPPALAALLHLSAVGELRPELAAVGALPAARRLLAVPDAAFQALALLHDASLCPALRRQACDRGLPAALQPLLAQRGSAAQTYAIVLLANLCEEGAELQAELVAGGIAPALAQLLTADGGGTPVGQTAALGAARHLAENAALRANVALAAAVPLVQLLQHESTTVNSIIAKMHCLVQH